MADIKLDAETREILEAATIDGLVLRLAEKHKALDRAVYVKVAKAINLAGGDWKTNKKGFLFAKDPRQALGLALETGKVVDVKKKRQAFFTPPDVARLVVGRIGVVDSIVLEPSAGQGALANECLAQGASSINCIEIDPDDAQYLRDTGFTHVKCCDFLETKGEGMFERIVMNPPFTKNAWVKHIAHAQTHLARFGKLISVCPGAPQDVLDKLKKAKTVDTRKYAIELASLPELSFKESGTDIATSTLLLQCRG